MRRREFISIFAGAAALWPFAVQAQQPTMPEVGVLSGGSEGRNVLIEYRWAEGQYDRLPAMATELVLQRAAIIATPGGTVETLAAKAATTTIPIVFGTGADPIEIGLVTSLNRPGGNITGVTFLATEAAAKMLEVLHEAIPRAAGIYALVNPSNPNAKKHTSEIQQAANTLRLESHVLNASNESEIEVAIETVAHGGATLFVIEGDPLFQNRVKQIAALTLQYKIAAVYQNRSFSEAGGLMSYGASLSDAFRIVGSYAGRIRRKTV